MRVYTVSQRGPTPPSTPSLIPEMSKFEDEGYRGLLNLNQQFDPWVRGLRVLKQPSFIGR